MTYDDWKATDPRDSEPDREQVKCDECGGTGIVPSAWGVCVSGRIYADCRVCEGRGWVWVKP